MAFDVADHGAAGGVELDLELLLGRVLGHAHQVVEVALAGGGQADVGRLHAQGVHQLQDVELLFDGRVGDRRRLQAIAQRLVEEVEGLPRLGGRLAFVVPVEDEFVALGVHRAPVKSSGPGENVPRPACHGVLHPSTSLGENGAVHTECVEVPPRVQRGRRAWLR